MTSEREGERNNCITLMKFVTRLNVKKSFQAIGQHHFILSLVLREPIRNCRATSYTAAQFTTYIHILTPAAFRVTADTDNIPLCSLSERDEPWRLSERDGD
jgi:hypothetical protein